MTSDADLDSSSEEEDAEPDVDEEGISDAECEEDSEDEESQENSEDEDGPDAVLVPRNIIIEDDHSRDREAQALGTGVHSEYVIPFGPYQQVDWTFEQLHPYQARAQELLQMLQGRRYVEHVSAWQGRAVLTYNDLSSRVGHAARVGSEVVVMSGQLGRWVVSEARHTGEGLVVTARERLPVLMQAVAEEWAPVLDRVGNIVREGLRSLPPLEPQRVIARGRRRY